MSHIAKRLSFMANRLSDDNLRKSLQEYGEEVGPITPTTRSLWEKRLTHLQKSNGPTSKRRSLNAFSSDDSEIESAVSSRVRKKRTLSRNESTERLNLNRSRELNSSADSDIFKKPSPVHIPISGQGLKTQNDRSYLRNQNNKVKTRKSLGKSSTFDVETSDSDFDAESSFNHGRSVRLRKKSPGSPSDLLGVSLKKHTDSTNSENSFQRKPLGSSWNTESKSPYHFSPIRSTLKRGIYNFFFNNNLYFNLTLSK